MHKDPTTANQVRYLIKVLLGLALLSLVALVALRLPDLALGATARQAVIVLLVLILWMQVPLIRWLYGRADELRQLMHRQACASSLAWLAAGNGIAGVLQANGVIPTFNQFWALAALVALWGVQLMLADRRHH
jgi:hypothetical protein